MLNKWSVNSIHPFFTLQVSLLLWFKTSLLGLTQRTDLPLAQTHRKGHKQPRFTEKRQWQVHPTGLEDIWILHIYCLRARGLATAFGVWEVKGRGGMAWIRKCWKKNCNKKHPDVRARGCLYICLILFLHHSCTPAQSHSHTYNKHWLVSVETERVQCVWGELSE